MERIRALIVKLKGQSDENADVSAMMTTVQMLHAELSQVLAAAPKQISRANVAVVLPSSNHIKYPVKGADSDLVAETKKQQEVKTDFIPSNKVAENSLEVEQSGWLFNPVNDIPNVEHQKEVKEMNDLFGQYDSSLNDKLKSEKKELASVLTEGPVKDLRKAIGVNDRFVFVNELFRGDEAMYERSIKTINNFRIFPEAEYWIERELKVKLGWDENKESVKQFRKLVRRRFS